ncbi:hypothetical protein [Flavobacterium sp.]|uniref:hypothetical protein n=1 Tax=Flavobacterium sp. TaxID=239 RepID=UPI0039E512BA
MQQMIAFFLLFVSAYHYSPETVLAENKTLTLQWNKAYAEDTIDKSAIGLQWALSYCGAMLPNAPYAIEVGQDQIILHPEELGFNAQALQKIKTLHDKIRSSDEYQKNKSIDLGRYIALLIGAPEHYYQITGVPEKFSDLLSQYQLQPEIGYVNHSGVSRVHRKIQFSQPNGLHQLFVSTETDSVTGAIYEYETIDIMPNAQVRFGIFDADGNRKNHASSSHSEAGKPAKCMWCHESIISPMFNKQDNFPGFLTYLQLQDKLVAYNALLTNQKLALPGGVRFAEKQQHTLTELLYISFMEPSAERLALEWNIPVAQVQTLLAGQPTHIYEEFPFLGNLYHRTDVEAFAPFKGLTVSTHVREASLTEVNHLSP